MRQRPATSQTNFDLTLTMSSTSHSAIPVNGVDRDVHSMRQRSQSSAVQGSEDSTRSTVLPNSD